MIPRNLGACRSRQGTKGTQDRGDPVLHICQPVAVRKIQNGLLFTGKRAAQAPQAIRENDRAQAFDRLLEIVVDQNVSILVVVLNLTAGGNQAALNNLLRVFAAVSEAAFQRLAVGRQYENTDRIRQFAFDLFRTLHIDIEQKIASFLFGLFKKQARRAVIISEDLGVLEEFIGANHLLKFGARNKVILLAILLAAARLAGSVGNGKIEVGDQLHQFGDERGFARTGRSRNNVDNRLARRAHSRFCTCSRDFSISDFMASPASVIFNASPARPEVFDSRVLASRFISWRRKSSFLPISPPSSSSPRKCCT